ncbi:hypothetical protein BgiMline_003036 [Biomphalaria glabrata]|nr:transcription termination factor; mitochondrial isoform X1 [Biomphalaria glabrata]
MKQYPEAISQCAPQAAAYGKCVVAKENIQQNICQKEFEALKDCIKNARSNDLRHQNCEMQNKMQFMERLTKYFFKLKVSEYRKRCTEVSQEESDDDKGKDKGLTPKRLKLLSTLFDYPVEEVPGVIAKYKFLNHLSLSLITDKVKIMQDFNLSQSFMKNNMRIMYHSSTWELQKRLELLKTHGFLEKNPVLHIDKLGHYLECPNEIFHLGFQKLCNEYKSLEGCSNQEEYIQKRLCCSKESSHLLVSSYPLNRGVSNAKLKEFLDFVLIEANLSPDVVINNMRLCSFSVTRLRDRFKIMQSANISKERWFVYWNLSENKFNANFV